MSYYNVEATRRMLLALRSGDMRAFEGALDDDANPSSLTMEWLEQAPAEAREQAKRLAAKALKRQAGGGKKRGKLPRKQDRLDAWLDSKKLNLGDQADQDDANV